MAKFFSDYTADFQQLLLEVKRYISLQKRYWTLDLTEKLAKLLVSCVLILVCLLLASIALLTGTFALAYWIGSLTHSLAIGFLSVSAIVLVLVALVVANRDAWITRPITRMLLNILTPPNSDENDDE